MNWKEEAKTLELYTSKCRYVFNKEDGQLILAQSGGVVHTLKGVVIDAGIEGAYLRGMQGFDCLDPKRTWEVPHIAPTGVMNGTFKGFCWEEGALVGLYEASGCEIRQCYDLCGDVLRVQAKVKNLTGARVTANGTAFHTMVDCKDGYVEFPTNAPSNCFYVEKMKENEPIEETLVGCMTHLEYSAGHLNVLFLDTVEKWSQGAYKTNNGLCCINIAAVECWLEAGEEYLCGDLYIQPVAEEEDPYIIIRDFFDSLGYHAATDGIREGVMYSCHPHGTMDGGFKRKKDLYEYAEELPRIRALGVDHVWILPVFEHLDRGVYHPTDQKIIDERYGGEEALVHFCNEAHRLGMTVLFDYVPHGPEPTDPLGIEKREWASTQRDMTLQDEWNCVSFDMTNPAYLRYTSDLVNNHVRRFDIDGARIDCAMGGLSNWTPFEGHRPSASNLSGGVEISRAIKRGFQEMGKKALVMPENFYPVPAYYPVTDVFYGMNFFRALVMAHMDGVDGKPLVDHLTRFLEIERKVLPVELKKLRFLGNHDTVSWVWLKQRAVAAYGVEKAKALFALMAFLDGVPMIYQGDEDPTIAGKEGPNLEAFFTHLFKVRKEQVGEGTDVEYLHLEQGVMAFTRKTEFGPRLVLINLESTPQTVRLKQLAGAKPLYMGLETEGDTVTLPPYHAELYATAE